MHQIPTLRINHDDKCPRCGEYGTVSGYECLNCIVSAVRDGKTSTLNYLPPFWQCDQAIWDMGKYLINKHRQELANARIFYRHLRKHITVNGKIRWGSCTRISAKDKILHGWDFVIDLPFNIWCCLNSLEQEALLFHELLHAWKDGDEEAVFRVQPHDFEVFAQEIEEYGLWNKGLERLGEALDIANRKKFQRSA
jgi:hypothetical protein